MRRKSARAICGSARDALLERRLEVAGVAGVAWCASRAPPAAPRRASRPPTWRNEATMIAIAAISEKLATIAARLTAAWPGAPRSWASASEPATGCVEAEACEERPARRAASARLLPRSRQAIAA